MRKLALILAALILPACENDSQRDNVRVTINNHGATETARVQVEVRRAGRSDIDRETLVSPGSSAFYDFDDVTRLAVRVYRNSDNFKIFDDFWDANNLRHLHDTVVVDVSP